MNWLNEVSLSQRDMEGINKKNLGEYFLKNGLHLEEINEWPKLIEI